MVRTKAEIDLAHSLETAEQQTGNDQQDEGNCDLHNDQDRPQPRVPEPSDSRSATLFQAFVYSGTDRVPRRSNPADKAGHHSKE